MMRGVVLGLAAALAVAAGFPGAASAATQTWTAQQLPLSGQASIGGMTTVSCLSADDCLAGGDQDGDGAQPLLGEWWDGSSWQAFTFAPPRPESGGGQVSQVLCVTTSSCFMVGYSIQGSVPVVEQPLAEHWDGVTWTRQTIPVASGGGELYGISCPSADDCIAVGRAASAGTGHTAMLAEHWDGSSWAQQPIPKATGSMSSLLSVSCPSGSNCTAVGENDDGQSLAGHWNGSHWAIQPTPVPAGAYLSPLDGVSCPKAGFCLATGYYAMPNVAISSAFTEIWDGHGWALQPLPLRADATGSELYGVSCVSAVRCTAAGWFTSQAPGHANRLSALAEYWTGSSWAPQPTAQPSANRILTAISCTGPRVCTAAGERYLSPHVPEPIAENENQ
jgi:hypothetical protein